MTQELSVQFQRLPSNPDLPLPARATSQAAGYDILSAIEVVLNPGEIRLISTGLIMELPEGMECQVRPRSGLALKYGITLPYSPGTIAPDYRGEVKIIIHNLGAEQVTLIRGERVPQLVFSLFESPEVSEVKELSITDRGEDGFGSTGTG